MTNEEIENYIKEQKARGVTDGELKKVLVDAGYFEHEFSHIIAKHTSKPVIKNSKDVKSITVNKKFRADFRKKIESNHVLYLNLAVIIFFGISVSYVSWSFNSKMTDMSQQHQLELSELKTKLELQEAQLSQKESELANRIDRQFELSQQKIEDAKKTLRKDIDQMNFNAMERDNVLSGSIQGATNHSLTKITEIGQKLAVVEKTAVDFTPIIPKVLNSVVTIGNRRIALFETSGAGVLLNDQGYVLTNYHVVDDMSTIEVRLYSGDIYRATLVGKDEEWDVAVLKIISDKRRFEYLDFGDSDGVFVGEHVIAVGNPAGFDATVTEGIISNTRRLVSSKPGKYFFQTDVAISPGNSGGPLINRDGDIVGIVTLKYTGSGAEGLSFALKGNDVKRVANNLMVAR